MSENKKKMQFNFKQMMIWLIAMAIGFGLGWLGYKELDRFFDFTAKLYTNLFKFVAVPTIALAITTTLASLGSKKNTGKIFLHTIMYTLLTTVVASLVGVLLYLIVQPENLVVSPEEQIAKSEMATENGQRKATTAYEHILNAVPSNVVAPFAEGNVLGIVLVAAAAGLALAAKRESENIQTLIRAINGLQELFFTLIRALVWALPLGIVAFSAQLAAQIRADVAFESLGKYVLVVLGGNVLQFFVILPLFLLISRINPLRIFRGMLPAVLMALFTKSSAATLPVTIASAENNLNAKPEVSRFVLPICCTINMNGCAAFIMVTSLFVMQNGGVELTLPVIALWVLISVVAAVGNAGVPMGCYFLTLSLMASMNNMPIWVLGVILPIYAIIDMIETAVNVWSDSCVCAMVDKAVPAGEKE
ncbi:MAG: dicarboxylate/amino acid:cation symporter [Lentisphaerae bacterium]|nr:dicarboxylate/amino acid:cation symporter [Lentisphaerota bacterium]